MKWTMDLWTIANKAVVLVYVVATGYFLPTTDTAWFTLALLSYICLNTAIPIFKSSRLKVVLVVGSAAFVLACGYYLDALFFLLLAVHGYELAALLSGSSNGSGSSNSKKTALLLTLLPSILIPATLVPLYILTALLGFALHAAASTYEEKVARLTTENDQLQEDIYKLNKTVAENKAFLRQSTYTGKLEERHRLSQQIHDEVGHAMAGALIQMEAARRLLATDHDKASELLGNAIAISQDGLERIRLTLKNLKPRPEEIGINKLRLLVDELSANQDVTTTLTHSGNLDVITPLQWRIIQENAVEAVTNTLKYGRATAIHFEIEVLGRVIKAVVIDDGVGAAKVLKGLGIIGMEERAAAAGGTVIVDGSNGFSVTTLLPYDGA
ncbi:sensor histidine kinase [Numidum massiliense]|uniref:sensor histidine kinase n=1 Tax=Numidum massiliense TaxID=1522315 RepID=UPI000B0266C6|nr:histidine kinase [Numidum massiliense]